MCAEAGLPWSSSGNEGGRAALLSFCSSRRRKSESCPWFVPKAFPPYLFLLQYNYKIGIWSFASRNEKANQCDAANPRSGQGQAGWRLCLKDVDLKALAGQSSSQAWVLLHFWNRGLIKEHIQISWLRNVLKASHTKLPKERSNAGLQQCHTAYSSGMCSDFDLCKWDYTEACVLSLWN